MASIEPAVQVYDDPEAGYGKNDVQQVQIPQDNQERQEECCGRKKCWIIVLITTVVLIIIGVVLGVVFGVVLKDDPSTKGGSDMPYKVEIWWQATTYDTVTAFFGFIEYGTEAIVKDGGEEWDNHKEFLIKLDIQDNKAIVKSEVHHICCSQEMEAGGNIIIDSGNYGNWGGVKNCRCDRLWYDHQIKARVTRVDSDGGMWGSEGDPAIIPDHKIDSEP